MSEAVIYLHIGVNKTGTSALQRFFNGKREALKAFKLLYPHTGCRGDAHYGLSNALNFFHGKANPDLRERATLRHTLHKEIAASRASHVLISSENFVLHQPVEPVKEFFQPYPVKIVVYLRRHDAWWESAYGQAVKMVADPPWGRGFEAYLEFQRQKNPRYGDYRHLLDRWARVFGAGNIIVRPYEAQQNQPDIVNDLLHSIGHARLAERVQTGTERVNESVSPAALYLMDQYQRAEIDQLMRLRLLRHAMSLGKKRGAGSIIPPALRRQLAEAHANDYAYIATHYMGRADGRLFFDPLPDPDEAWSSAKRLSSLRIIEETVKALS